jgi:photosystem II stability/assembly factor-like uncharacterized protein
VAGEKGLILKTVNGGSDWTFSSSTISDDIIALCSLDARNLVAVGWSGIIVRTADGGGGWGSLSSPQKGPCGLWRSQIPLTSLPWATVKPSSVAAMQASAGKKLRAYPSRLFAKGSLTISFAAVLK